MGKKVPFKNVSRRVSDLRWPEASPEGMRDEKEPTQPVKGDSVSQFFASQPFDDALESKAPSLPKRKPIVRRIVAITLIVLFVFAGFTAFNLYRLREKVGSLAISGAEALVSAISDLRAFHPQAAESKLSDLNKNLNAVEDDPGAKLLLLLRQGGDLMKGFQGLTGDALLLAQEASKMEDLLFDFIVHRQGGDLIASLQKIHSLLSSINDSSGSISGAASTLKGTIPFDAGSYLPFQSQLRQFNDFLGALVGWLTSSGEHHVLVFLQNPSEIRPGGGFLGSYADVVFENGNIKNVEVHDVNDPDKLLQDKIIPPVPLQALVKSWRAADSNWFFDFPTSASKTIQFLEASDLYKKQQVTFDAAVALSPKVIGDLLGMTGPIKLPQSRITLDQKNFLIEIQKQVQAGQATDATYPKGVLQEAAPLLFEKLGSLDQESRATLFELLTNWVEKKDVMVYFKNDDLESFLSASGAAGSVYVLPQDFKGDYLAVVDANIGGGKSDLYMKESVLLQSQLGSDGVLTNHLEITRTHNGGKASYWWYKVTNQDYLQVFTPTGVRLTNFKGGTKKTISPPLNYAKSGYSPDATVLMIESSTQAVFAFPTLQTHQELAKNVFSTWSRLGVGETAKIVFDYERRLPLVPQEGTTYEFIFDKQAGTERQYHFEISAPLGFRWQESNAPVYEFQSSDPSGREMIMLTLAKN